jgi:hypothetical protein
MKKFILPALLAFLAVACGGSDPAPSLGGTAAIGAPVDGGTVTIKCSGGAALSTTTSASGKWSVQLSGQTFPCIVQVTGGSIGTMTIHSVAQGAGNTNVTPLTDLIVAAALGQDPAQWLTSSGSTLSTALAQLVAAMPAAQDRLFDSLEAAGYEMPGGDPFSAPFSPVAGDPYDDLLEAIGDALANSGLSYEDFVEDVATGGGEVEAPFSGELGAQQLAGMPQLNAAALSVSEGALNMTTSAGTSSVGAFVGSGNGNKAVLQLPGMAGLKLSELRSIVIDMKRDANAVAAGVPYVSVDLTVDTQCGAPPLAAGAKIIEARTRYRIATFDAYYNFIAPGGAASGSISATGFTQVEITPATKGWRVSRGDGTNVGDMEFSGSEQGNGKLDFSNYPNACIADAATADAGMFRDREAHASCATSAALDPATDLALCGKAYRGMTLFLGSSSNSKQSTWQVRSIKVNDGMRSYTFK